MQLTLSALRSRVAGANWEPHTTTSAGAPPLPLTPGKPVCRKLEVQVPQPTPLAPETRSQTRDSGRRPWPRAGPGRDEQWTEGGQPGRRERGRRGSAPGSPRSVETGPERPCFVRDAEAEMTERSTPRWRLGRRAGEAAGPVPCQRPGTRLPRGRNRESPRHQHKEGQDAAITARVPDGLFSAAWLLLTGDGKGTRAHK